MFFIFSKTHHFRKSDIIELQYFYENNRGNSIMFLSVMKKDELVCQMEISCLSLSGVIVQDFEILNPALMPFPYQENMHEDAVKTLFHYWFSDRVISNDTPNLDQKMFEIYNLKPHHYGRMYYYQYLGALLSYMVSSQDEYWINPLYVQYLSYVLIDRHFIQAYPILPTDFKHARKSGGKFQKCLRNPTILI